MARTSREPVRFEGGQVARGRANSTPYGHGSKAGYTSDSGVAGVDARRAMPQIRGFSRGARWP